MTNDVVITKSGTIGARNLLDPGGPPDAVMKYAMTANTKSNGARVCGVIVLAARIGATARGRSSRPRTIELQNGSGLSLAKSIVPRRRPALTVRCNAPPFSGYQPNIRRYSTAPGSNAVRAMPAT